MPRSRMRSRTSWIAAGEAGRRRLPGADAVPPVAVVVVVPAGVDAEELRARPSAAASISGSSFSVVGSPIRRVHVVVEDDRQRVVVGVRAAQARGGSAVSAANAPSRPPSSRRRRATTGTVRERLAGRQRLLHWWSMSVGPEQRDVGRRPSRSPISQRQAPLCSICHSQVWPVRRSVRPPIGRCRPLDQVPCLFSAKPARAVCRAVTRPLRPAMWSGAAARRCQRHSASQSFSAHSRSAASMAAGSAA